MAERDRVDLTEGTPGGIPPRLILRDIVSCRLHSFSLARAARLSAWDATLAAAFAAARETFDEVDETLKQRLSKIMFDGPADELTLTANAQPALMAMSLAVVRGAGARGRRDGGGPCCCGGGTFAGRIQRAGRGRGAGAGAMWRGCCGCVARRCRTR